MLDPLLIYTRVDISLFLHLLLCRVLWRFGLRHKGKISRVRPRWVLNSIKELNGPFQECVYFGDFFYVAHLVALSL